MDRKFIYNLTKNIAIMEISTSYFVEKQLNNYLQLLVNELLTAMLIVPGKLSGN
jgi:hypothetical protein